MPKKNKIQMPQSSAGLMRYYDSGTKTGIKFKPEQIVVVIVITISILFALQLMI